MTSGVGVQSCMNMCHDDADVSISCPLQTQAWHEKEHWIAGQKARVRFLSGKIT